MSKSQQDLIDDLMEAARDGDLDLLRKTLCKLKPDNINARNDDSLAAIRLSAQEGHEEIVQCLIEAGADIDVRDDDGWTALHIASKEGHAGVVKRLLKAGANLGTTDDDETARDIADDNGHDDIAELLENAERLRDIVEWSLLGSAKLVHIEASLVLDRKLVEIFNFESRERLTYLEKLKPGSSEPPLVMPAAKFDDLPEEALSAAFRKFTQLGGKADESFVFRAKIRLDKSPLKPKQGD